MHEKQKQRNLFINLKTKIENENAYDNDIDKAGNDYYDTFVLEGPYGWCKDK